MKSFVKKVTVLAVAFSMASSTLANAQEEDGKVNFSVQGDLVSSYIWRGFYQTGASFQPTLSLGVGNFSLTAWGSTDFQGANSTSAAAAKEIDLTAAYTFGSAGPTLSVASLWWAGQGAGLPSEKFPLSITWNFMFAGQDKDENGNQNYSSYVELNFPFTVKGVDLNATCGVLPYDAGVTTYGGDVNSGFAVTNVALKAMKDIKITNSFSLPIFIQAIWNPRMEDAHLVLGISLRP